MIVTMTQNPILDELHATRERLLAESGGTVSGLLARLRAEQAASDRLTYQANSQGGMTGVSSVEHNSASRGDR